MDLGVGLPTLYDVKLIETNHATQDGRTTNVYVPTKKSGDSSHAGAGSTKRCFGVQLEIQKKIANEPERKPQSIDNASTHVHPSSETS